MGLPRLTFDPSAEIVSITDDDGTTRSFPFSDPAAFEAISRAWLRVGWDVKHVYSFAWMGQPVIQLPEDLIRTQEAIYALRPDVIVETGIAHGGSLIFYASLCRAMGHGRVVGVDIEIRPHNREAIERHEMFDLITMFEGSSTDPDIVEQVRAEVGDAKTVLILLDSNHTRDHVLDELRAYADLVSVGSWIVATDGIMAMVAGGPRTAEDWTWNNPLSAIDAFLEERKDFRVAPQPFPFNEGVVREHVTYWPSGWLQRIA